MRAVVAAGEGGCAERWVRVKEAALLLSVSCFKVSCCLLWVQAKEAALLRICLLRWVQAKEAALLHAAVGSTKGGCAAACCGGCRRRWLLRAAVAWSCGGYPHATDAALWAAPRCIAAAFASFLSTSSAAASCPPVSAYLAPCSLFLYMADGRWGCICVST
jgi:hypothetical protein